MSLTADITNDCGSVAVGTKLTFYLAEAHDVNPLPAPTTGTKLIEDDITCKTGKKFIQVECVFDTTGIKFEMSGDVGFQTIINKAMFALKKIDLAKNKLFDALVGCGVIALIPDKNTTGCWVFGEPENPSFLGEGTAESGIKSGDKNWYNFVLNFNGTGTPFFYTGVIPLTPAP